MTEQPVTKPSSDPTLNLWRRVRRPVGAAVLVWIIFQSREALTSGNPLPTVAALVLISFFGWVLLRHGPSAFNVEPATADELRATYRREISWWSLWTVLAAVIVAWASAVNGFEPYSLIPVAIPLFGLLGSVLVYRTADRLAAKAEENRNR